jgi:hypothetical protein
MKPIESSLSVVAQLLLMYVFTGLLPSNGCPSVVGCGLVGTCLPLRLLAIAQSVTILDLIVNYFISSRCHLIGYFFRLKYDRFPVSVCVLKINLLHGILGRRKVKCG